MARDSAGIALAFLPDGQSSWTEELARFLLIWISLLGAALAFERRAHLGVDYSGRQVSSRRAGGAPVGEPSPGADLCHPGAGEGRVDAGRTTLSSGQVTPALGLKKWIVYAVVPVSGIFVILFTIQNLMGDLKTRPGGGAG
jgi:TRAP-type C4-dicarboxylate transport system permease small subunit